MAVKVGTTASGTYNTGTGLTYQRHLIYAATAGVWWYFTITSAKDAAGNPGTHVITAYFSSGPDLTTATWTAAADSPNFDESSSRGTGGGFQTGRSLGVDYWNNPGGANQDIALITAAVYQNTAVALNSGVSYNGLIRAVLTANSITWGVWGGYVTPTWSSTDTNIVAGDHVMRLPNGFLVYGSTVLHSELDAGMLVSQDPDVADAYTTGNIAATGNATSGNGQIAGMSNQTGAKVGFGMSYEGGDYNGCRYAYIASVDDATHVTWQKSLTGTQVSPNASATGADLRWWQFTPQRNRFTSETPIVDTSMAHECEWYGFAPLGSGGVLSVYDSGDVASPNFADLHWLATNVPASAGLFPPVEVTVSGSKVFGSAVTNDLQDVTLVGVDAYRVFCARRNSATAIDFRAYDCGKNAWSSPTQPPALTGKTIKAGGGVFGATDGVSLWLFVIDSTDNAIKYVQYTPATDTWGAWTQLETVVSTATRLSGFPTAAAGAIGLCYIATNGSNFDTFATGLALPAAASVGVPY